MRRSKRGRKSSKSKMDWAKAKDVQTKVEFLVKDLELDWVNTKRIRCVRSKYSSSRAVARIWGLSQIWQLFVKKGPLYIIEVISERFDKLSGEEQGKVLLHELVHIPQTFSGALLPHTRRGKTSFYARLKHFHKLYLER